MISQERNSADASDLEGFRAYLQFLVAQRTASRYRAKIDFSGVVQETLLEAHQELAGGAQVPAGQRLPWLRRILANNLADQVRRLAAGKRDAARDISLQALDDSSHRLEQWVARDLRPHDAVQREEEILLLVAALEKLPSAQREALVLQYWGGLTLLEISKRLACSRDAVAGLIKRGVRALRLEMGDVR